MIRLIVLNLIFIIPISLDAQSDLESIINRYHSINEHTFNSTSLNKIIDELKPIRFEIDTLSPVKRRDIVTSIRISYMYADLSELDSAFHYLEEGRMQDDFRPHLMIHSPPVRLLLDKRFDSYLDTIFHKIKIKSEDSISIEYYDIDLYKEIKIIDILEKHIKELDQMCRNNIYLLNYRDSTKALINDLLKYRTTRYKEFIKSNGFPISSEYTSTAAQKVINHLLAYSKETIIDNIDYYEQLAIKKEIGAFISSFVDEVLISSGKEQKYGTQLLYLKQIEKCVPYPIYDSDNVDLRRKEIGLMGTMEQFVKRETLRKMKSPFH